MLRGVPEGGLRRTETPAEILTSVGTMSVRNGTFGIPIRYTDRTRRRIAVRNLSGVNIQVGYSGRNVRAAAPCPCPFSPPLSPTAAATTCRP
jgi:hypothetical protein